MKALGIFLLLMAFSTLSIAQTLPANFSRAAVGGAIANPTVMAFAPDGRIFVAEQGGTLRVIKDGVQQATPFITLSVNSTGERGLIGIAFDPDFSTNHYLYLYYTVNVAPIHNRISRFTATGDVVLAGSESIILELDPLNATNHNGGALAFGKDGKLYVAIGENAVKTNAQSLETYHGKMLRINKDGSAPTDNPFFATGSEHSKRIWAYGLRNPYTFSIHPTSGRILINDVGEVTTEEVNDATTGGKNFGWPTTEGVTTDPLFTSPIFTYIHTGPQPFGCALTGGTFFSPPNTNYPAAYQGKYFILDLCSSWIYYFDPSTAGSAATAFSTNIGGSSLSLTVGPDGNLYYLSRTDAKLYKIVYSPPATAPVINNHPQSGTVVEGQPASLSVTATGTAPITYQWYRDDVLMDGKTSATLSFGSINESDEGTYHVIVSNGIGSVTSDDAILLVSPATNQPPVATIITPIESEIYRAGSTIGFEGAGTDPEEGTLASSAFSWSINFHHDTHKHDEPAITGIKSGTYDVPTRGETSTNVWYRFILTVTDLHGLQAKDSVDVHPATSTMTFATDPPGLQLTIDGQPATAPITITSVEGLERDVVYIDNQVVDGTLYAVSSLSHGEDPEQTIVTPEENTTYTATYAIIAGLEDNSSVAVYPNPATGSINIADSNISSVRVVNSIGRSITLTPMRTPDATQVEVSQLSPGVYVIFYSGANVSGSKRIVVR